MIIIDPRDRIPILKQHLSALKPCMNDTELLHRRAKFFLEEILRWKRRPSMAPWWEIFREQLTGLHQEVFKLSAQLQGDPNELVLAFEQIRLDGDLIDQCETVFYLIGAQ
jgi:hypothetical protein